MTCFVPGSRSWLTYDLHVLAIAHKHLHSLSLSLCVSVAHIHIVIISFYLHNILLIL